MQKHKNVQISELVCPATGSPCPVQIAGFLVGYPPPISASSLTSPNTHTFNSVPSGWVPCGHDTVQVGTSVPQTLLTPGKAVLEQCLCQLSGRLWPMNNDVTGGKVHPGKGRKHKLLLSIDKVSTKSVFKFSVVQSWSQSAPHAVGGFLLPLPDRCCRSC